MTSYVCLCEPLLLSRTPASPPALPLNPETFKATFLACQGLDIA
jgi:hypothetical protein